MKLLYFSSSFRFLIYFSFHAQPFQLGTCHTIGKFIHQEMDVNRQCAVIFAVRAGEKLLEKLSVQDADKEVETAVIIRDYDKQRGLFLADGGKVKLVRNSKRGKTVEVELLKPCGKRDLNGFEGFVLPPPDYTSQ